MFPGYFALIMSTGIISNSAKNAGLNQISKILFFINIALFAVLLAMLLIRLISHFPELMNDLGTYEKNPGFLTLVAALGVFGVGVVIIVQGYSTAMILLMIAVLIWLILMISFFIMIVFSTEKPPIEKGLSGLWLLLVVSTQAIALLASELSSIYTDHTNDLLHLSLMFFFLGCALYLILIPLILYRLAFFILLPAETNHSYWIDTGGAAISVVSGLSILDKLTAAGSLNDLLPVIKGISILFWVIGTWWIPIALKIEIWRYFFKKVQVKYHPVQWSMIFVVGNYSMATTKMGISIAMPGLIITGRVFLFLSFLLWISVFSGMIYSVALKRTKSYSDK